MARRNLNLEYFKWMYNIVCADRYTSSNSYEKLLMYLHDVEFTYTIKRDADRFYDGINLRQRFGQQIDGPCSVLEMMVALAIRCEETIMTDPKFGDRTSQWFWRMIVNLGLGGETDSRFDEEYVRDVVDQFLHRNYQRDGRGGLFTVKECQYDLRDVDIWTQMMWYLDDILGL